MASPCPTKPRSPALGLIALLAAMLAAAPTGCGRSVYFDLADERADPRLAALATSFAGCKRRSEPHATLGIANTGPAQRVVVHEFGEPQTDRLVVLIHGAFSDHTAFRFLVGEMAQDHDLLLIDLPGCGESDAPDPEYLPEWAYSPDDLAWRSMQALRAHLRTRDQPPRTIALVGHSLGGTVALRALSDPALRTEFADVNARVDRIVLISAVDPSVQRPDPTLLELAEVSIFRVFIASTIGTLRDRASNATQRAFNDPSRALRQEAEKRVEIMEDADRRRALQAMIRRAVPLDDEGRMLWDRIDTIVAGYGEVTPPTLVLWGARDEVVPVSTGYKLAGELPNARLLVLPHTKHSPFIEHPAATADLLRGFFRDGLAFDPGVRQLPEAPVEPQDAPKLRPGQPRPPNPANPNPPNPNPPNQATN